MIYIEIAFVAIMAALACYRSDERKRSRGESDCSGKPWDWKGWL